MNRRAFLKLFGIAAATSVVIDKIPVEKLDLDSISVTESSASIDMREYQKMVDGIRSSIEDSLNHHVHEVSTGGSPYKDVEISFPEHLLADLDKWGRIYGLHQFPGETPEQFRTRIIICTYSGPGIHELPVPEWMEKI